VGVSALRYPSGQTDPLDIGGQVSTSLATGIVVAEIHAESDQPPGADDDDSTTTSRQTSATAAAARLPPEGPSHVYIDDFAKLLKSHGITAKLFADDVKFYFKINSVEDGVLWQQALDLIAVWASEWQLSIYVSKCNLFNTGRSLCELKYSNNSIQLPECETCRDLGVIIASDLPTSVHICEITLKTH